MGVEENLESGILITSLDAAIDWGRRNSIWPATFGLACCALEMMATSASHYDIARFGSERFSASPRQADLMIVAGTLTRKMAPVLKRIYDQMTEPKWVIAFGSCASTGGIFNSYAVTQGVDTLVPVDFYVPGCPPRPEALLDALMSLQKKIATESIMDEHRRSKTVEELEAAAQAEAVDQ